MVSGSEKDIEQDEMIRRNAESIRRNEEAIRRQTECLEKICGHYYPRRPLWKTCVFTVLKIFGVVLAYAGLMESVDWFWNQRVASSMARQSSEVAKRLLLRENDPAGALRFLEKAVRLDGGNSHYLIRLAYVKGIAAIGELSDLGRPFTAEERRRVDEILAEAVFLQEVAPEEPMPHVLAAQAQMLRGENAAAVASVGKAVEIDPENAHVRMNACAIHFAAGDFETARTQIEAAERLNPSFPFISFWKGRLAIAARDWTTAKACFAEMMRLAPNHAIAHLMMGSVLLNAPADKRSGEDVRADLATARDELALALKARPSLTDAMVLMGRSYEREENFVLARIWYDRVLAHEGKCMEALVARARLSMKTADYGSAVADLTKAIELAPLRADLYLERAKAHDARGEKQFAAEDQKRGRALEMDKKGK